MAYALEIVKCSRHSARCRECHQAITWATIAARGGKSVPLAATPLVLREVRGENGVIVEVLGWDQVHRCPVKKHARPSGSSVRSTPPPSPAIRSGAGVFASFTNEKITELRRRIDQAPAPKPPETGRLW